MTSVPHSGNECSGMCVAPCDHETCWQCMEIKERPDEMAKATRQRLQALAKDYETPKRRVVDPRKSLLGKLPAQQPKDHQTTTITRAALEDLADKAGIAMDWNDGSPIFRDGGTIRKMEEKYRAAERAVLEEKVKTLEDIAAKRDAGNLTQQAANSMAKAAGTQSDTMMSDLIKRKVEETLREDIRNNEAHVKQKLKDAGASDDDIAAAEAVLGWKPEGPTEGQPFEKFLDPNRVQAMVNAQLQSISGLGDLLEGRRPQAVSTISWDEVDTVPMLTTDALRKAVADMNRNLDSAGVVATGALVHSAFSDEVNRTIASKISERLRGELPRWKKLRIDP